MSSLRAIVSRRQRGLPPEGFPLEPLVLASGIASVRGASLHEYYEMPPLLPPPSSPPSSDDWGDNDDDDAGDGGGDGGGGDDDPEAGLEPEFVGRIPVRVALGTLSEDDLFAILKAAGGSRRRRRPGGLRTVKRSPLSRAVGRTSTMQCYADSD